VKTHGLHGAALAVPLAIVLVFGLGIGAPRAASQCGKAAWYDRPGKAASGEQASATAMVAAHRSLPFGTRVRVENLSNGRSVILRINDRGPAERDRVIDVSRSAAAELGFISAGITEVKLTTLDGANAALERPCLDDAVATSSVTPLPRTRPTVGTAPVAASVPPNAADAMAARFGLAFQEDDWMPQEMAKAIEALTAPH
jgi:peptidoglycan lytic transglycosylase